MFRETICEYNSRAHRPSDSRCLLTLMKLGRVSSSTRGMGVRWPARIRRAQVVRGRVSFRWRTSHLGRPAQLAAPGQVRVGTPGQGEAARSPLPAVHLGDAHLDPADPLTPSQRRDVVPDVADCRGCRGQGGGEVLGPPAPASPATCPRDGSCSLADSGNRTRLVPSMVDSSAPNRMGANSAPRLSVGMTSTTSISPSPRGASMPGRACLVDSRGYCGAGDDTGTGPDPRHVRTFDRRQFRTCATPLAGRPSYRHRKPGLGRPTGVPSCSRLRGWRRGGATLVTWHVPSCSRSTTRGIASVAATRIAGAVEPLSVDWSSGGSLPG